MANVKEIWLDDKQEKALHIYATQMEYLEFISQEDPTVTIADCGGVELDNVSSRSACNCAYDCHGGSHYHMSSKNTTFIFHIVSEIQDYILDNIKYWNYTSLEDIEDILQKFTLRLVKVKKPCCSNHNLKPEWNYCPICGEKVS